jgi:hypothetical protein
MFLHVIIPGCSQIMALGYKSVFFNLFLVHGTLQVYKKLAASLLD